MVQIEDKLADIERQPVRPLMPKIWVRMLLGAAAGLAICSIIIAYLLYSKRHSDPNLAAQMATTMGMSVFFILPVTSMILAAILSFIPIRQYNYQQKYWVFTLVIVLLLEFLLFVGMCSIYIFSPKKQIKTGERIEMHEKE